MTGKGAMDECLGEVGRVDVVMKQRSDLNGEIIMAIWEIDRLLERSMIRFGFISRNIDISQLSKGNCNSGDPTDQRSGGQNVLHSILDGEHTSMVTIVGPEEPPASYQGAEEEDPASDGGSRSTRRSRGARWSCCFPREILQ